MDDKKLNTLIDNASEDLSYVIREVGKRGSFENELDADDFEKLLLQKEFKDLVVGELYEAYFLPERHESDWQVLRELVTIFTSEPVKEFIVLSIVGGVLGNTAFAVLRAILRRIAAEMGKSKLPASREDPFRKIQRDVDGVEGFFHQNECARMTEIESSTGIPREKLYPLLRLLGFKHYRRDQPACHWCRPGATPHIKGLAKKHGVHRRVVRQATASAIPPEKRKSVPKLDPVRELIDRMLEADRQHPRTS